MNKSTSAVILSSLQSFLSHGQHSCIALPSADICSNSLQNTQHSRVLRLPSGTWWKLCSKHQRHVENAYTMWLLSWQAALAAYTFVRKSVCLLKQYLWLNVHSACLNIALKSLYHIWVAAIAPSWTVCKCLLPTKQLPRLRTGYFCSDRHRPRVLLFLCTRVLLQIQYFAQPDECSTHGGVEITPFWV